MRSIVASRLVMTVALVIFALRADAQTPPPLINPVGPVAHEDAGPPLTAAATVDEVLDALHERGQNLKEFVADLSLTESDVVMASQTRRHGRAWFQTKVSGDNRLHVRFDKRVVGDRPPLVEIKEYLLEDGWLTDRDYRAKVETRRQVARPGEKVNLFQLGKGPFPLPIGQDKKAVLELFEVSKVAAAKDDPQNSAHLLLKPKEKTEFAQRFISIDVWVDVNSKMPVRIKTMDKTQTTERQTDLQELKVNPKPALQDEDFALPPIEGGGWNRHEEPFTQ